MKIRFTPLTLALLASACLVAPAAAAVSAEEAGRLKSELTPFGAEKAGNKDGSIPAWTGGYTQAIPGDKPGGRRGDPFKDEKPLFTITAKNMEQYADRLTDGQKAMLKKYPDSYRLDVYRTHRTAAAPQWVYDNTFKNATRAKLENSKPVGAYGGIPFPVPKTGEEAMWNHLLRWRGEAWEAQSTQYQITADGRSVLTTDGQIKQNVPYYFKDGSPETFKGFFWDFFMVNAGPPLRAGEMIAGREHIDGDKSASYVYLTGQRRVRKLPNACCDTPTPASAGLMSFDEVQVWSGRLDRFDWKIVGKQEMLIPYNNNKFLQPTKDAELLAKRHLNPDHVRWELHRVWVVEATLKSGQRHQAARSRYYLDEDTWAGVLADRWDANGQLWKSLWTLSFVMPDLPGTVQVPFGYYDLLSGTSYLTHAYAEKPFHYRPTKPHPEVTFTADGLTSAGVR
ncbi:DUF1329 domain-containing protein [Caldimonas tepidiphila]|uniref:DUF1329 domain-containing protein n=1 Tax=Caldimonas tepidiphila TaxID=2315841 RepID=UPI000E5B41D5|nr:DUF1329 domain-containing protein [Caldimonas tepidiphila]